VIFNLMLIWNLGSWILIIGSWILDLDYYIRSFKKTH